MNGLRIAFRSFLRTPAFTIAAVLTLGVGIAACTAAWSVANGLLWRPLPFDEPDRIVVLHGANPSRGITDGELSYADLRDLREQTTTVRGFSAMAQRQATLRSADGADRIIGWLVDPQLFVTLGMAPALGRVFRADEGLPGAASSVVLSHRFWTRRFGRDTSIIDSVININGGGHRVIGVMPADFQLVRSDVFLPLVPDADASRDDRSHIAIGRLLGGATTASARAELAAAAARLSRAHPATNTGWTVELNRYRDDVVDAGAQRGLIMMLGAVGMVLLIACANVAGLMLARAAARDRELAVRAAVGASRGRLVRQLLGECSVIAALGAVLGVGASVWWTDLIISTMPPEDLPIWLNHSLDWSTLAVTAGVTVCSVFLFGLLPALKASRPAVVDTLKGTSAIGGSTRIRAALVVSQVALAVILLAAATLFSQSFLATRRGDLGFSDRNILTARVFFGALQGRPPRVVWMEDALQRVRAVPGVTAAAVTGAIPGDDGGDHRALGVEGSGVLPGEEPIVGLVTSSDGLLDAIDLRPVAGRWFTAAEATDRNARVAVIGATLARRLWPNGEPLGKRVRALPDTTWLTIVGVVNELQYEEFGEDGAADRLQLHIPYGREPWRSAALMVRTAGSPAELAGAVSRALRSANSDVPIFDVMAMAEVRRYTTAGDRIWMLIFGSLGAQALLMAAVGLYGLLAFGVAQRRREIGVRIALGARPTSVVKLVVGQAIVLTGIGLVLGLGGGAVAARLLRGMLWGVNGTLQPLAVVSLMLLITAGAAALVPARRAARVDPMVALRSE